MTMPHAAAKVTRKRACAPGRSRAAKASPAAAFSAQQQEAKTPASIETPLMSDSLRDLSVVDLLHRASQSADVTFQRHARDRGLNARQYAVLRAVSEGEGLSQKAIVEATGIDRSTLAAMVQRLVRRGLLQRRRTKHDARAYAVRLTPAGRDLLSKVAPQAQDADAQLLGTVHGARRGHLRSALVELIAAAMEPRD